MFNNSISLDIGCDNALNKAGGLSFLEEDEMNIIAELEGEASTKRVQTRNCYYSFNRRRCRRCRYMRRYRGGYFCCGRGCNSGRIPRVSRRCSWGRCTILCSCRRRF